MGESKPRIVYFGTPHFAVPTLRALVAQGYDVALVVSAPAQPAGRGLRMRQPPVAEAALELGLPLAQPADLQDPALEAQIRDVAPDLGVVIAFRKLPQSVWSRPRLGTFNVHASLLPAYRGAAPINWAIINGEAETGLTTFRLNSGIDQGEILLQQRVPIHESMQAGELYASLSQLGAELALKTIECLLAGQQNTTQQPEGDWPKAPKIFRHHCEIDWKRTAKQVHDQARGLAPTPGAWAMAARNGGAEQPVRILRTSVATDAPALSIGELVRAGDRLLVGCGQGALVIEELQMPGKKRVTAAEWLRGNSVESLVFTVKGK